MYKEKKEAYDDKSGSNRPGRSFEDVKEALNAIDVNGITVSQVMGCGAQRGYKRECVVQK